MRCAAPAALASKHSRQTAAKQRLQVSVTRRSGELQPRLRWARTGRVHCVHGRVRHRDHGHAVRPDLHRGYRSHAESAARVQASCFCALAREATPRNGTTAANTRRLVAKAHAHGSRHPDGAAQANYRNLSVAASIRWPRLHPNWLLTGLGEGRVTAPPWPLEPPPGTDATHGLGTCASVRSRGAPG